MPGPVRTEIEVTCTVYGTTPFGRVVRWSFSFDTLVRIGGVSFLLFFIWQDTTRTYVVTLRRQDRLPSTENVDGTRSQTSGWSLSVSQMTEDLVPSGLGSVSFLPRQARLSLCTPLFGKLWFSTSRTHQSYPLHHFLASISLVGVASSWATNDAADGIVLVFEVHDRAEH